MIRPREPQYGLSRYGNSRYGESRYGESIYGPSRYGESIYGPSRYGESRYRESQQQEGPQHISVFRNVYKSSNLYETDFSRMITLEKYNHVLFIFNDNDRDHETSTPGLNNAEIREYNYYNKVKLQRYPHSAGIPTGYFPGTGGGYKGLSVKDNTNKEGEYPYKSILFAYAEIMLLLYVYRHHYNSIIYSVESANSTLLAMGTFQVDYNVIQFISYLLSNINYYYELSYKIFERSDQNLDKATVILYNKLLKVVHQFIKNEKKNGKINLNIDHEEHRRELRRKEEENAIKKREEERKREEEKDRKREEEMKREERENSGKESEYDKKQRKARKREKENEQKREREKENEQKREREKEKERDRELKRKIERDRERDKELTKQLHRENEIRFQEETKEYHRREEGKEGQGKDGQEREEEEYEPESKMSELKDDAKKMKKRVKGFFKLMEKYKDTLKDINKNETKLYKLLINMNTEIVNIPNVYYTSSMINKNEEHKYIYVNPYLQFTKEMSLYNKNYKIKQKEKDRKKKYLNEQLLFNVKEILKIIFKEGTVIYLGKELKPYVIQGYTSQKAILDDNDKDDEDDDIESKQNNAKKGDAIMSSLDLDDENDVLNTKIYAFDIIKISYFNNNKIITTSINLKLFPGKTLPTANSPNIKLFDCLRKQNDVHKKFMVFSGLENWKKTKRTLFENETVVMPPFIDDAVYAKYTEGKTDENMNEKKNEKNQVDKNKKRGGTKHGNKCGSRNRTKCGSRNRTKCRSRNRTKCRSRNRTKCRNKHGNKTRHNR